MRAWNSAQLFSALVLLATLVQAQPQSKPIRRPPNNQLALETSEAPSGRIDPPTAIAAITNNLVFHVSPLSGKGLLSQQVDDALKALDRANGNAVFVKLRAFVVGTGDLRRIQTIVNELFTTRRLPLPALTTVQAGALTLEGAQVVIESISEEKKSMNPSGLAFFPAREAASGAAAVAALETAMKTADAAALRVTCFSDSLAEAEAAQTAATKAFPKAARTFLQATRFTLGSKTACEGIAQASTTGSATRSTKLILTAPQLAFTEQDADLQLAFERLNKTLEPFGVTYKDAALINLYSLTRPVADSVQAKAGASGSTSQLVEGLPSLDGVMAIEAMIQAK